MENPQSIPKNKNQKNPILIALSNIIVIGVPYLMLRYYGRFFLTYILLIIALFTVTAVGWLIWLAVIIDTYFLVKKMNKGESSGAKRNVGLNILGVITLIFYVILITIVSYFPGKLAWSADSCKILYSLNESTQALCVVQVESYISTSERSSDYKRMEKEKLTDPECEVLFEDDSLIQGGSYYQQIFGGYCYLEKAIETNPLLFRTFPELHRLQP